MFASIVLLIPAHLFTSAPSALYYLLSLTFNAWLVADMVLVNKLLVVQGRSEELNRKRMEMALRQFNNKMTTVVDEPRVTVKVTPVGWLSWGSIVTVLYEQDKAYLNISSLGAGRDNISPFHALYNYFKCKGLIGIYNSTQD